MGSCDFISSTEGATLCLRDMVFPADKQQVLDRVQASGAPEAVIVAANNIPDKTYENLEELLRHLQPEETKSES